MDGMLYNYNNVKFLNYKTLYLRLFLIFLIGSLFLLGHLVQGDLAIYLLIIISYLLCLLITVHSQDRNLLKFFVLAISIRHICSLFIFQTWSFLNISDSYTFHRLAAELSYSTEFFFDWNGAYGHTLYIWLLSKVYYILGADWLIGQALSVIAYLFFSLFCYKIISMLKFGKALRYEILLIIACLPSFAMYTSRTLREPWKLLLLAILIYYLLKFKIEKRLLYCVIWVLSSIFLIMLHKGMAIIVPVLIFLSMEPEIRNLLKSLHKKQLNRPTLQVFGVVLVIGLGIVWGTFNLNLNYTTIQALQNNNTLEYIENYRHAQINYAGGSRAAYGIFLNTNSISNLVLSTVQITLSFYTKPWPWEINSPLDMYGFIDAMISLLFLISAVIFYRNTPQGKNREIIRYLLLSAISISIIHAFGTINYGTAIRHRLMSSWLLIIVGWPYLRSLLISLFTSQSPIMKPISNRNLVRRGAR